MASDTRGLCGRCDSEYEPYLLMFTKAICYAEIMNVREEYGWLCPDCLDQATTCSGYAIAYMEREEKEE